MLPSSSVGEPPPKAAATIVTSDQIATHRLDTKFTAKNANLRKENHAR